MKRKLIVAVLAVTIALAASGCGRKPAPPPAEIGFVDYAKLYSNHPLAPEARELEMKINFTENMAKGFSVAVLPAGVNGDNAKKQLTQIFFQQEIMTKTQEAQNLVETMKEQEKARLKRYVEEELNRQMDADSAMAMDLNTKLDVLELDKAKESDLRKRIGDLFREDDEQKALIFAAKKQAAIAGVKEYTEKIRDDLNVFAAGLFANIQQEHASLAEIDVPRYVYSENDIARMKALTSTQLVEMSKRYEEIRKKVIADINQSVALVAKTKNLKVVVGMPKVNINFIDITDSVMEKLIHGN
ncbi:MAG: hypothetical protein WCV63_03440 [Negativicutes bacterium]|jgi:biotin-(acetyl-CoA carboxylase) ligase